MDEFHASFGPADTGEWHGTRQLGFRPRINCKRNDENPPILFSAEGAANHVAGRYGKDCCTLLEALLPTTSVKPYFDFELYCTEEPDTQAILQQQVLPPILKSLDVESEDVRVASRHGWVKTKEGQRFKVSFRAFVLGKQLRVAEMNSVIGRPEFKVPGWDKEVYPLRGERMMGVVGGVKGKDGDKRVLEPVETGYPYHEYLIQALDGNEEVMEVPLPKYAPRSIARLEIHSVDAAVGHSANKPDWLTITDESMLELASDYMFQAKMKNFRLGKITGNAIAVLNEQDNTRVCTHGEIELHKSNNASVLFYKNHSVMYNCYSSKCIDKEAYLLGTWDSKLPATMDEMTERDLREVDVNLVRMLLAAKEPKKDALVVQYLNRFLVAIHGSKPEIVQLEYDASGAVKKYVRATFSDTATWLTNATKGFELWKESCDRRTLKGYQYEVNPERCDPDKFNLFTGKLPMSHVDLPAKALTEEEAAYLQPLTNHILLHFCDGEEQLADYLLNWMAFPLQRLGIKTGVAVVVKGLPGTGKGLIFNVLMGKIYGEHYHQCKDIQDLTGTFNAHTAQKMLVNLDEATFGGLKRENQILKNFITEPKGTLTEKFKDSVEINSYVNLVITTNEDFPVAITEGDRRYFVLECSTSVANNHAYWGILVHLFDDDIDKTADLFYRFLMTRDLSNFRVREFPHTNARVNIMIESRDNVTAFLQHLAMNPDAGFSNAEGERFISSGRLYELYKMFVESGDVYGKQMGKTGFGRRMAKLLDGCAVKTSTGRGFKVPKSSDLEGMMRVKGQWSEDQF